MFQIAPEAMPHFNEITHFSAPAEEGEPLDPVYRLEKDQCYLKLGRSTGVTAGIHNGARVCCNWQG